MQTIYYVIHVLDDSNSTLRLHSMWLLKEDAIKAVERSLFQLFIVEGLTSTD